MQTKCHIELNEDGDGDEDGTMTTYGNRIFVGCRTDWVTSAELAPHALPHRELLTGPIRTPLTVT